MCDRERGKMDGGRQTLPPALCVAWTPASFGLRGAPVPPSQNWREEMKSRRERSTLVKSHWMWDLGFGSSEARGL